MKKVNKVQLKLDKLTLFLLVFLMFGFDKAQSADVERNINIGLPQTTIAVNSQIVLTTHFYKAIHSLKNHASTSSDTSVLEIELVDKSLLSTEDEGKVTVNVVSGQGIDKANREVLLSEISETKVSLSSTLMAYTYTKVRVKPDFENVDISTKAYSWSVNPSSALSIDVDSTTYEATILGLEPGKAILTFASIDSSLIDSIHVSIEDDEVLKILAIGNSFSEDALEFHLYGLAKAAGKKIIIGNMYIGGAEMSWHAKNVVSDSTAYSYRKIDTNGNKTIKPGTSLSTAIKDESWDYISFQQVSNLSGMFETFEEPLKVLYNNVKEINPNINTRYLLHRIWAYAQKSMEGKVSAYNYDQKTMFRAIVDAYGQATGLIPVYDIIPVGTAIQNARTSYLKDNFTRDGYHLNDMGRYIASCVWFEKLMNESVIGNAYHPKDMIPLNVKIAQQAAHSANEFPEEITEMKDF
ncbi:DUF4886 domain-containing protein [Membranihabitans marinus]|uniref:DUF4886 domain-containing protein n=1 Tax=Membranihabitans marinus TaxID=1227546 RepID=UPI001F33B519|nr:DUF4886 domain-containing protein [Membranihabitans marinus]